MSFITINLWSLLSVFFHWLHKSLSLWCLGIASVKVSLEVLGIGNLQKELKFISHKIASLARRSGVLFHKDSTEEYLTFHTDLYPSVIHTKSMEPVCSQRGVSQKSPRVLRMSTPVAPSSSWRCLLLWWPTQLGGTQATLG